MSDNLKRYKLVRGEPGYRDQMCVRPDGAWVRYEDAADRIAALEAEVARLREALVWCADAPLTETERLLGKPEPEMKHDMDAWMNSAPRHYQATLDAARAALEED